MEGRVEIVNGVAQWKMAFWISLYRSRLWESSFMIVKGQIEPLYFFDIIELVFWQRLWSLEVAITEKASIFCFPDIPFRDLLVLS